MGLGQGTDMDWVLAKGAAAAASRPVTKGCPCRIPLRYKRHAVCQLSMLLLHAWPCQAKVLVWRGKLGITGCTESFASYHQAHPLINTMGLLCIFQQTRAQSTAKHN